MVWCGVVVWYGVGWCGSDGVTWFGAQVTVKCGILVFCVVIYCLWWWRSGGVI